ncbi:hypothetical protein [Tranquillimonas alkanivorans]|uniref:Phage major tail protein, TP901-1 family n=1 Tax=Tranquillimonas alkanivorans TaxID=441119 RepID=A0A1I5RWA1_9RHOB|nr:hypothetical protein [Tranquillimonas alkanivorans]SFP62733.1 hypothetical protein SAMN04488047_109123 [Tranquillimonas alkanivorans]
MLMAVGGSRLFIGQERSGSQGHAFSAADVTGESWAEIGNVEGIGSVGVSWETMDVTSLQTGGGMAETMKSVMRSQVMEIILGADPSDAGQQRLWAAAKSTDAYAFRLDLPDAQAGGTPSQRLWLGLVTEFAEDLESASNVIKMRAALVLNSPLVRVAAA